MSKAIDNHLAAGATASRRPWLIVAVLFLAALVSLIDRQIINLLVDPIKVDLGITDTQISFLQGLAFAIFYAVMALPMGWLVDNWSRIYPIVFGMLIWSAATIFCGLAWGFVSLFVARMVVGIGEAALAPAGNSLIASVFPEDQTTRAITLFNSAAFIGIGLSVLFGGLVVEAVTDSHRVVSILGRVLQPWQIAFILAGVPGIVLAIVILIFVKEPTGGTPRSPDKSDDVSTSIHAVLKLLWHYRRSLSPVFVGLPMLAALQFGIGAWIPSYLARSFDWGPAKIGLVYGLLAACFGFLGAVSSGVICDALRRRGMSDANLTVGIVAAFISAVLIIALGLSSVEGWSIALLVGITFVSPIPFGPGVATIAMQVPPKMRGQAIALYFLIANLIGLSVGPTLIAVLTDSFFQDTDKVGLSIALAAFILSLPALLIMLSGRAHFKRMTEETGQSKLPS